MGKLKALKKLLPYLGNTAAMNAVPMGINTVYDREPTDTERMGQIGMSTLLGLAISPKWSRGMIKRYVRPRVASGVNRTERSFKPLRAAGLLTIPAGLTAGIPWLTDRAWQSRKQLENPKTQEFLGQIFTGEIPPALNEWAGGQLDKTRTWLGDTAKSWASEQGIPTAKDLMNEHGQRLGLQLAASVPGSIGGLFLGPALFPDDEKLDYKERRKRESLRNWTSLIASTGLGLGGTILADRLLPPASDTSKPVPSVPETIGAMVGGGLFGQKQSMKKVAENEVTARNLLSPELLMGGASEIKKNLPGFAQRFIDGGLDKSKTTIDSLVDTAFKYQDKGMGIRPPQTSNPLDMGSYAPFHPDAQMMNTLIGAGAGGLLGLGGGALLGLGQQDPKKRSRRRLLGALLGAGIGGGTAAVAPGMIAEFLKSQVMGELKDTPWWSRPFVQSAADNEIRNLRYDTFKGRIEKLLKGEDKPQTTAAAPAKKPAAKPTDFPVATTGLLGGTQALPPAPKAPGINLWDIAGAPVENRSPFDASSLYALNTARPSK
jgi:hypothetical protein